MTTMQRSAPEMVSADKVVESLVLRGDLSALGPADRARYYIRTCESLGLNPHSQPFEFLRLNGKEIMYARRGATDQLAAIHKLTREIIDGPKVIDLAGTKLVYAVCRATHPNGRTETATATVPLIDPPNVLMKCETKAKRRATLSILGLGMLDEMELETISAASKEPGGGVDLSAADIAEPVATGRRPTYPAAPGTSPTQPAPAIAAALRGIEAPPRVETPRSPADELRDAVLEQIRRAESADAAVGVWISAREECSATLGSAAATVVKAALRVRVQQALECSADEARAWVKSALAARTDPTPPDDGTSGPTKRRRGAATEATGDGAANDSAAADGATARAERPDPAADPRGYFAAKSSRTEVERAVRAHHDLGVAFTDAAVDRLDAIVQPDHLGSRPTRDTLARLVRTWRDEGVRRQVAADVRRAA